MSFKELKIEKESAVVLYLSTYLSFPMYFISSCRSKLLSVSFPSSLKNFLWKFQSRHARFIGYIILGGKFHQFEHVTLMFSRFFFLMTGQSSIVLLFPCMYGLILFQLLSRFFLIIDLSLPSLLLEHKLHICRAAGYCPTAF